MKTLFRILKINGIGFTIAMLMGFAVFLSIIVLILVTCYEYLYN